MSRIGAPRAGVTVSTPQLDRFKKWLDEVGGVTQFDLGGIAPESQKKIQYGLEAHGRPVVAVTPYLTGRAIQGGQRALRGARPTVHAFWHEVEREVIGVIRERVANAGGDLRARWAANPLSREYARQKARRYPGRPMGQASGALLRDLRSERAFVVAVRRRR